MTVDYAGIASVIGAVAALVTAAGMVFARKPMLDTHKAVTSTNGDTRPIGEIVADVAKIAGSTPPPEPPPAT